MAAILDYLQAFWAFWKKWVPKNIFAKFDACITKWTICWLICRTITRCTSTKFWSRWVMTSLDTCTTAPKKILSYQTIFLLFFQVHPDTGISSKAMSIMNSFVNDLFERIATEASRLAQYNQRSTITSREAAAARGARRVRGQWAPRPSLNTQALNETSWLYFIYFDM